MMGAGHGSQARMQPLSPDHPPELILSLFDPRLHCDPASRSAPSLGPPLEGLLPDAREGPGKGMGHLPDQSA